jgi:hypothetical protein
LAGISIDTILVGIGIAMSVSGLVTAQGVVTQRNVSLAMAKTIAEAALAECKSKGFNTSATVVGRAGQLLVIMRDEQATAPTAEMARRRAYTAHPASVLERFASHPVGGIGVSETRGKKKTPKGHPTRQPGCDQLV